MSRITVPGIFRELGLEPEKSATTAVGIRVRDMWLKEHDELPRKELKRKTAGGGSHCFATYPASWRDRIIEVIRTFVVAESRQLSLF